MSRPIGTAQWKLEELAARSSEAIGKDVVTPSKVPVLAPLNPAMHQRWLEDITRERDALRGPGGGSVLKAIWR